jgi:hypothetical protein
VHRGFIKLWRKICFDGLQQDHLTFTLWVYILCKVTHIPRNIIFNGKKVHLEPGQMITGRKRLAKELRVGEQRIRTSLQRLQEYENLTIRTTRRYSIISVTNWERYQLCDSQANQTSNQNLTNTQPTPNHKQETSINKKNTPPIVPPASGGATGGSENRNGFFDQFWSAYPRKVAKQAAVKAFKKIKKPADLMPAILAGIKAQRETYDWQKEDGHFIPYPATWLNGHRWEDKIECEITRQPTYDDREEKKL